MWQNRGPQSVVPELAASTPPGNLLEIQVLGPPLESGCGQGSEVSLGLWGILTLKMEKRYCRAWALGAKRPKRLNSLLLKINKFIYLCLKEDLWHFVQAPYSHKASVYSSIQG